MLKRGRAAQEAGGRAGGGPTWSPGAGSRLVGALVCLRNQERARSGQDTVTLRGILEESKTSEEPLLDQSI